MTSSNKARAAETYAALNKLENGGSVRGTVRILVSDPLGNEVGVLNLFDGYQFGGGIDGDSFLNKSLEGAKVIFSRLAAGNVDYRIAKIAFGNAGHSSTNPKQASEVLETETSLTSLLAIIDSINAGVSSDYFTRLEDGVKKRLVYIEKDILEENISYGEDGNQFVVRVPINYDDFNRRVSEDQLDDTQRYEDSLVRYKYIDNGTLYAVGNVNTITDSSDPNYGEPEDGYDFTEVQVIDDDGTTRYHFKNGYDENGDINTTSGGIRPQEISEIALLTDIIGEGTAEPQKLAASKMTSGLLSFPEGFQFTYEWTLTWNFQ